VSRTFRSEITNERGKRDKVSSPEVGGGVDGNGRGGRGRGAGGGIGGEEDLSGVGVALLVVEGAAVVALDRPRVRGHRPIVVRRHLARGPRRTPGADGSPDACGDHPRREDLRVLRRPPNPRHGPRLNPITLARVASPFACPRGGGVGRGTRSLSRGSGL
jgi:hypothetical protein